MCTCEYLALHFELLLLLEGQSRGENGGSIAEAVLDSVFVCFSVSGGATDVRKDKIKS